MTGPKIFHVLFFINVHTRKVHIAGITNHPTQGWVNNQAETISSLFQTGKKSDKLLIRDGKIKYDSRLGGIIRHYYRT